MLFPGFASEDFDLFAIPEFDARMAEIRARVRPKLLALGEDLTPQIASVLKAPTYLHVAQHLRRRVNPPTETWAAFAREKRGYKRWTHYRVAISGAGVRVTVFVEDDADDKAPLGASFEAGAEELIAQLAPATALQWYTLGDPYVSQSELTPERLQQAGRDLQRLKTVKFQAGISMRRQDVLKKTPEQFERWAIKQVRLLKPLYLAGAGQ